MTTSEIKSLLAKHRNIEFAIDRQTLIQKKDSALCSELSIKHEYADWKWEQGSLDEMVRKFVPRIKYYQKKYPDLKVKVAIKNYNWDVVEEFTI